MKWALRLKSIDSSRHRLKLAYAFASFLAFMAGVTIYAIFRNLNIVLFQIFPKPLFWDMLYFPVKTNTVLMSLFLYNLPDGLWFLSGLLAIRAVWLTHVQWRAIYAGLFTVIALLMEMTQIFEHVSGTFDVLDIICMVLFAFVESIIFNMFIRRSVLR